VRVEPDLAARIAALASGQVDAIYGFPPESPEPSGIGPGVVLSETSGVFVASRDAHSGEGSVTMLTTGI
jgi:ABC-type nitrate/sulfonate/bicarbonate transport system substrate-binding protein